MFYLYLSVKYKFNNSNETSNFNCEKMLKLLIRHEFLSYGKIEPINKKVI